MVKNENKVFTQILLRTLAIKTKSDVFLVNLLKNRKKSDVKFKSKTKQNTIIIFNTGQIANFLINLNKNIQININRPIFAKKRLIFLLRKKIKWNFNKIKYNGKGFKVKKFATLSKITFRLGKSHWTKILYNSKNLVVKRTKKNTYCLISIKNNTFLSLKQIVYKIKGINKYTKRGVRLVRQSIIRRFGKISQNMSIFK